MATAQRTQAEKNPTQTLVDANVAVLNTLVEASYKAQSRTLNVARVLVEGIGRQQENARRLVDHVADPNLPWYAPERYSNAMNVMVENQNEALRIGREYIDEMNAAAAESRQTVETLVQQAGKAREAQQAIAGQGFAAVRRFTGNVRDQAVEAVRA